LTAATAAGLFLIYNALHYVLFLLVTHPKDARKIGYALNEFEKRQLVERAQKVDDFLKHDDENRTYDEVFGPIEASKTTTVHVCFHAQFFRLLTKPNTFSSS
jgi:hypothetical protein